MQYAEEQLRLPEARQYRGTVSPPVMLILTVALIQCIGLAVDGASVIVNRHHGMAGLVNDNTSLFMLRLVLFGSFALVLATRKVHRSAVDLDRDSLKPAFYAQCYAISPFALLLSSGMAAAFHSHHVVQTMGLVTIAGAFMFYSIVQVRWFQKELNQSVLRSCFDATIGVVASIAITIFVGLLFQ